MNQKDIKFRAWNKEIGAMGIVSEISWGDNYLYASFGGEGEADMFAILNRTILMQYTGLKDKNGKEIYEGDIIKNDQCSENLPKIFVVEWGGGCFGRVAHENYKPLEIIGNIYENPDLIKEEVK